MSPSQSRAARRQTYTITNRHDLQIFVVYDHCADDAPLAVVAHGLSDVHDSRPLEATASALLEAGYNVLRWDSTHSWGRSGGTIDKVTLSGVREDLEDVLSELRHEPWSRPNFILAGHSLGGAAALQYAVGHPDKVDRLILIAPVVAGKLLASRLHPAIRTAWRIIGRLPQPGQWRKYYRYELLTDALRYNGLSLARRLDIPVIAIAASRDHYIPLEHVRQLITAVNNEHGRLIVINEADHWFSHHFYQLKAAITSAISMGD